MSLSKSLRFLLRSMTPSTAHNSCDFRRALLAFLAEVVVRLHAEPHLCARPERSFETQRHRRTNARTAINKRRQRLARHPESLGRLGDTEILREVLAENLSGVCRIAVGARARLLNASGSLAVQLWFHAARFRNYLATLCSGPASRFGLRRLRSRCALREDRARQPYGLAVLESGDKFEFSA